MKDEFLHESETYAGNFGWKGMTDYLLLIWNANTGIPSLMISKI